MKKILKLLKKTYKDVIRSIAFYPVLISFFLVVFALLSLTAENWKIIISIKENLPHLFIQDYETALSLLSTLLGGIISLTVFSFSMVMVVLSQASSNFSPRLLPGLISDKKNQIILGFYIGTLLNCIITLIALGAYGIDSNSLGLSTMFAAISGVVCIGLFVYFIHSISRAIQIHNIIERIFNKSYRYLEKELQNQAKVHGALSYFETDNWIVINSKTSGYFREFDTGLLHRSITEQNNQIVILAYANQHVWEGIPILKIKEPLSDSEYDNIDFCLNISSDRHDGNQAMGGMIKLMEIAVKALSPGINDPGTAIDAINKLGQLLGKIIQFPKIISQPLKGTNLILTHYNISITEIMRIVVQPIRFYAKEDISVLYELVGVLQFVMNRPNLSNENRKIVALELDIIRDEVNRYIDNPNDKGRIISLLKKN